MEIQFLLIFLVIQGAVGFLSGGSVVGVEWLFCLEKFFPFSTNFVESESFLFLPNELFDPLDYNNSSSPSSPSSSS